MAALKHFASLPGWEAVGVSRRPPTIDGAEFISVDLFDESECRRVFSRMGAVTHLVYAALQAAPGVEPFPSTTNFILFRLADGDTAGTHARFLEQGILIRDISMWPGCAGCLRVSIGTPEENAKVVAAIGRVVAPGAKVQA